MYGALTLEGMCHCAGLSTWVPIAENKPGPESQYWVLGTVGLGLGPHPPSPTRFQADHSAFTYCVPVRLITRFPSLIFIYVGNWAPGSYRGTLGEPVPYGVCTYKKPVVLL